MELSCTDNIFWTKSVDWKGKNNGFTLALWMLLMNNASLLVQMKSQYRQGPRNRVCNLRKRKNYRTVRTVINTCKFVKLTWKCQALSTVLALLWNEVNSRKHDKRSLVCAVAGSPRQDSAAKISQTGQVLYAGRLNVNPMNDENLVDLQNQNRHPHMKS